MDKKALKIKSDDEQLVFGPVYVPDSVDSDVEAMARDDVKKMAYEFLSNGFVEKIDVGHSCEESGNMVVESYLARDNDPDFVPGTWLMTVKVNNAEDWAKIKKGEITGYSFFGMSKKETKRVLVEIITAVSGETKKSADDGLIPTHSHDFFIEFDDNGTIVKGSTFTDMEHSHVIYAADATEISMDHAHRINLNEEG